MPKPVFTYQSGKRPPVLGAFVTFDSMPMVEILAGLGFDYLAFDIQHAMLDAVGVGKLMYALPTELPVLVRAKDGGRAEIGQLLDFGADGVIIPMVETAEQAADAVAACRYKPAGTRSIGPVRRHIGSTPAELEARAACFVMIETIEAVENIEAIVATEGLTGVYFAAGDLAVSMGLMPVMRPTPPEVHDAAKTVARVCARAGIVAGAHGQSVEHVRELVEAGFTMVTLSGDRTYVTQGATNFLNAARQIGGAL